MTLVNLYLNLMSDPQPTDLLTVVLTPTDHNFFGNTAQCLHHPPLQFTHLFVNCFLVNYHIKHFVVDSENTYHSQG